MTNSSKVLIKVSQTIIIGSKVHKVYDTLLVLTMVVIKAMEEVMIAIVQYAELFLF